MKISFPHPMILLIGFIFLAAGLTNVLPAGEYERSTDVDTGKTLVVPNSYHEIEAEPVGFFDAFITIPAGIIDRADVIVLILLIGGAFYIVDKTGAFNQGLFALIHRFKHSKSVVMILVGLAFAVGGATENMHEEIIAMIPLMLLLTNKLGYKREVAVGLSLGSAVIGAAFSPINPFQVMIAQIVAQVDLFSGAVFRMIFLVIALGFWYFWLLRYGKSEGRNNMDSEEMEMPEFSKRSALILMLLGVTFVIMVLGIVQYDWGYNEMSALFLAYGFIVGLIGKLGINGTSAAYAEGMKEMAFGAVVVGLAGGISLALQNGKVIDTIVYGMFQPLQDLPVQVTALGSMVAQTLIHIPVSSVSGQAALTMPLVSPLADLLGMSRQIMVLTYQYGAGIADLFIPTNGAMMAMVLASGITYKDWLKFIWKPMLFLFGIASIAILVAISINLS